MKISQVCVLLGALASPIHTSNAYLHPTTLGALSKLQRSIFDNKVTSRTITTLHQISENKHDLESTTTQPRNAFSPKNIVNGAVAATIFCSAILMGGGGGGGDGTSPSYNLFQTQEASAAVAPLADVGIREFLVKDGKQFLRLGLPTSLPAAEDPSKLGDTGRTVQQAVELVRLRLEQVGFSGKTTVWNAALKEVNTAKSLIDSPDMVKGIDDKARAKELVDQAKDKLDKLTVAVRNQDITSTLALQEEAGSLVGEIRALSLTPGTLPYTIPSEYSNLPRLRGRATVKCTIVRNPNAKNSLFTLPDGSKSKEAQLTLIIDGYHAPLTGGNFVDLVQRKFYNDMPIQSIGDLIVQTGRPPNDGSVNGFVDPSTRQKRTIPLELFYKKDNAPTYGYTSDDDMRATESFVLPFQSYGALGMDYVIEDEEGVNSGSSEFWFLKWDQNLVAPSRNTLDGSHSCFGYVVDGADLLGQIVIGDKIESMRVTEGSEFLSAKG